MIVARAAVHAIWWHDMLALLSRGSSQDTLFSRTTSPENISASFIFILTDSGHRHNIIYIYRHFSYVPSIPNDDVFLTKTTLDSTYLSGDNWSSWVEDAFITQHSGTSSSTSNITPIIRPLHSTQTHQACLDAPSTSTISDMLVRFPAGETWFTVVFLKIVLSHDKKSLYLVQGSVMCLVGPSLECSIH